MPPERTSNIEHRSANIEVRNGAKASWTAAVLCRLRRAKSAGGPAQSRTLTRRFGVLCILVLLGAGICVAQNWRGGGRGFGGRGGGRWANDISPIVHTEGGIEVNEDTVRTARETQTHSRAEGDSVYEIPNWTNAPGFEHDVFTFARIIYKFENSPGPAWRAWINDYPDSDLNLSFRLQQITSMKVDPNGRVLKLTNPDLVHYPFIYIVKPGRLEFRDEEVPILRKYLLNGGFLWLDDFWGSREWDNFEREMKRVFPDREWVDLPIEHPLFHCVFDLKKEHLQVPNIHAYERTGSSSSRWAADAQEAHIRAWLDDKKRIMVLAAHNTDNGDGWERESENTDYFLKFSEPRAYPLAINIIFYTMTH
jgi:hypothetical protein